MLGVLLTSWFSQRNTAHVIRQMGDAYSSSLRAAMAEPETMQQTIARLEHELMIEGHQHECPICIENNMTLRQKAIRAMQQKWNGR